jgi:hypothetical protein
MVKLVAAASLLAALTACQPSWSIHGQVASVPVGSANLRDGSVTPVPIAHAKVTLRCPGKGSKAADRVVQADRLGLFEIAGDGAGPSLECVLVAEAAGHAPAVTSMDEACADDGEAEGSCASATLMAELEKLQQ